MKNQIILGLLIGCLFTACKKEEKQNEVVDQPKPAAQPTVLNECYQLVRGKDTIAASLTIEGQKVSGNLVYNFYEKDRNKGSILGTIKGDTLVADYTFQSEGQESIRQVTFLRKDKTLIEGYGESKQEGNKSVFLNAKAIQFTSSTILKEVPCK